MWPTKRRVVTPVANSQRRKVLSHDAESAYAPSDEMTYLKKNFINPAFHNFLSGGKGGEGLRGIYIHTQSETMCEWPCRDRLGNP